MAEPLVKNAADVEQVKRAGRKDRDRAADLTAAVKAVMFTPAGRRVMWELLERAGIYKSIFVTSSEIYYRAGRQDYGHELLALLISADEDSYALMEAEARLRGKRERAETDASHTASVEEGAKPAPGE